MSNFSFSSVGSHALKKHLKIQTPSNNHKTVHYKKHPKIALVFQSDITTQSLSSSGYFKHQQPIIGFQSSNPNHTTNAEILWMLKVFSVDYCLRSWYNITKLFHSMLNCNVTKNNDFTLDQNKIYILFLKWSWTPFFYVSMLNAGFAILFDETTKAE